MSLDEICEELIGPRILEVYSPSEKLDEKAQALVLARRRETMGSSLGHTHRRGGHALALASLLTFCLATGTTHAADLWVWVLEDETDSYCSGDFLDCSLREAILQANLNSNHDTIHLPPGTMTLSLEGREDLGVSGDLDILYDTTIIGQGAAATTIDGTEVGERVLHIVDAAAVVTVEGMSITGGGPTEDGAGILNYGSLSVTDCEIHGNIAGALDGGGIYNTGSLTLTRTTVRDNLANKGGGIFQAAGPVLLVDSTIADNAAATAGGGLYFHAYGGVADSGVIDSSTISGNQALLGGGIYVRGQASNTDFTIDITNSTLSGNIVTGSGGGAYLSSGITTLRHVTIAGNTAPIISAIASDDAALTIRSTVIEGDCAGTITSTGSNVESPGDTCSFDQATDRPGEADPGLKPLAGYGGPTETHAIVESSPARSLALACPQFDQRGAERWATMPVFCDSGAFEYGAEAPGTWIFADGFESGDALAWSDSVP